MMQENKPNRKEGEWQPLRIDPVCSNQRASYLPSVAGGWAVRPQLGELPCRLEPFLLFTESIPCFQALLTCSCP